MGETSPGTIVFKVRKSPWLEFSDNSFIAYYLDN